MIARSVLSPVRPPKAAEASDSQADSPLGLARVTTQTEAGNQRSRAVAARLGFTEEGLHRQAMAFHDQRRDQVLYGLLADEWRARRTTG